VSELSVAGGFGIGSSRTFAAAPGFFALASASTGSCGFPLPGIFQNWPGSVRTLGPPIGADVCRSI